MNPTYIHDKMEPDEINYYLDMIYGNPLPYEEEHYMDKTHPSHYEGIYIEPIDVLRYFPFDLGNAIKYIYRAGKKEGESVLDDLRKAEYYLKCSIGSSASPKYRQTTDDIVNTYIHILKKLIPFKESSYYNCVSFASMLLSKVQAEIKQAQMME